MISAWAEVKQAVVKALNGGAWKTRADIESAVLPSVPPHLAMRWYLRRYPNSERSDEDESYMFRAGATLLVGHVLSTLKRLGHCEKSEGGIGRTRKWRLVKKKVR